MQLAPVDDALLAEARALVDAELVDIRIRAEASVGAALDSDALAAAHFTADASFVYTPSTRRLVPVAATGPGERVVALRHRFESLQGSFSREQARLQKLAERVGTLTNGFVGRASAAARSAEASAAAASDKAIELSCFRRLAHDEAAALPARLAQAQAQAQEEADRERTLQARYAALARELDGLRGV